MFFPSASDSGAQFSIIHDLWVIQCGFASSHLNDYSNFPPQGKQRVNQESFLTNL